MDLLIIGNNLQLGKLINLKLICKLVINLNQLIWINYKYARDLVQCMLTDNRCAGIGYCN